MELDIFTENSNLTEICLRTAFADSTWSLVPSSQFGKGGMFWHTHLHGLHTVGNLFFISPFWKMAQMSWVPTGLWDLDGSDVLVWKPNASSEILAGPSVEIVDVDLNGSGEVSIY